MRFTSQSGFTLVELLVTISIITLLSSITAVNVHSARISARNASRLADIRNILTTLQAYYVENGTWPWYPPTDPRNTYTNGQLVCSASWEPTRQGMWCKSKRPCELAACGNQPSCNGETYWLPPIDKVGGYFSPNAPRDPLSKTNCSAPSLYSYQAALADGSGIYFILAYDLELPLPSQIIGKQSKVCDVVTRTCQFEARGYNTGEIL